MNKIKKKSVQLVDESDYIFHQRDVYEGLNCAVNGHDWKILLIVEEENCTMAICKKCAELSGGWCVKIEKPSNERN